MHNACRMGDAVRWLKDGAGGPRRGQEVGHRCSCDQRTRRRVRQYGGLGVRMSTKVWVGARSVVWAAVGESESVPMHGGRDVGLWSPVGKVPVPFLMAGTEMLHLPKANRLLLLGLECRGNFLRPVEEGSGVMMLSPRKTAPFGLA